MLPLLPRSPLPLLSPCPSFAARLWLTGSRAGGRSHLMGGLHRLLKVMGARGVPRICFSDSIGSFGAAAPRELKARMTFVFCANRLCEMRAVVEDDSRVATYANALRSLRAAFGGPPQRRLRVDHVCLGELVGGRGDRCLEDRGAGVRHWWEVGGTEIFLALERRAHGPALEIAYRDAARLAALSATSD